MKLRSVVLVICGLLLMQAASAQVRDEMQLRRADRGKVGVDPEEIVSFSKDMHFTEAIVSLSEMSKKFTGKIIVDPNPDPARKVNVAIESMPWRDALELILRTNNMWYRENEQYFQLFPALGMGGTTTAGATPIPAGAGAMIDSSEIYARQREVTISAIFIELDRGMLRETGVDFTLFRGSDLNLNVEFNGASRLNSPFLTADVAPTSDRLAVDLTAAISILEESNLGNVIARPQVTVRSGQKGRVQVGEDFSVKQRTISGDITERFFSVGSILEVTPTYYNYNDIDFIELNVKLERSSLIDPVNNRIAKTEVGNKLLLFNGEQSYVGGLFITEERNTRAGIPILKDLPWWVFGLRYIFGYEKTEVVTKELIAILQADLLPTLQDRVAQRDAQRDVIRDKLEADRKLLEQLRQKAAEQD